MSSRKEHSAWFKIRLLGALLILITLPTNKGVAQLKRNLPFNSFRQEMIVRKDIRQPEKLTGLPLRTNYRIETYQSPLPSTWTEHHGELVRLMVKRFNLAGNLQYDKQVDNFDFNLKGQVKLNSRVSVQMAVFIFHVPRPRFLGASKSSSVSPYQLQGTLQLQKEK